MYFFSIYHDDRPLVVRPRSSLSEVPETAVVIGEAPDGLPLILRVERRASVAEVVLGALATPRDELAVIVRDALERLEEAVAQQAKRAGIEDDAYRTQATVGALMGETMLARLLGAQSPLILEEDRYSPSSQAERVALTSAVALAPQPATLMNELDSSGYLTVPLREGPPQVVELAADKSPARPPRLLLAEDLRPLPSARYHYRLDGEEKSGQLSDVAAYQRAMERAEAVAWSASRVDIGGALVELARGVAELHDDGAVHGDIKPGNALLVSDGARPIDALRFEEGAVASAATPGWAAPEQVLARPVSKATDVYALGLMATRLVEGAIYGEERSFVVPTGGRARRRLRLLADPEVFVDPTEVLAEEASQRAWRALLSSCVAFDPERRPADAAVFADRLAALLQEHPPSGRLAIRSGPGQLTRNVVVLGRVQPAWVMRDSR